MRSTRSTSRGVLIATLGIVAVLVLISSCRPLTNPLDEESEFYESGSKLYSPIDNGYIFADNPVLSWPTVSSAKGYHIQINTDEDFNGTTIVDDDTLSEAQYTLSDRSVLTEHTPYYWRVRVKKTENEWYSWITVGSFRISLTRPEIGDQFAGGTVFYIDENDYVLVAAPASTEWVDIAWGHWGTSISGADGTAVGTGKQNTADIVAHQGTGSTYAAQLCDGLIYGGYDDWFLPSKDELNVMYENLHTKGVGGFADYGHYWSSSEYDSYDAWLQTFYDGPQWYDTKDDDEGTRVRAVRFFRY